MDAGQRENCRRNRILDWKEWIDRERGEVGLLPIFERSDKVIDAYRLCAADRRQPIISRTSIKRSRPQPGNGARARYVVGD